MSFDKLFIVEKLKKIKDYLKELKLLLESSDREIFNDAIKMYAIERLTQLIVDEIIDINQHFIKELNLEVSEDFQGTFYILGEHNILPKDFSFKIAPVVGIRNRLVHRYETLDRNLFIGNLRENYKDFEKYIILVRLYLDNK